MSNNNEDVAGVAHLGARPSKEKKMIFNIHGFENLSAAKHFSPPIFCHGYHWKLGLYPNGNEEAPRGHVSLFLVCLEVGDGKVECVQAMYTVRVANHPLSARNTGLRTYAKQPQDSNRWGFPACWTRDETISYCDANGTLVIEVSLQVFSNKQEESCWRPGKSSGTKMARLYHSKYYTDVTFVIGQRRVEAHRWILKLSSPTLAGMLNDDAANQANIPITGANPDLFETLIRFLYTEDLPPTFNDEDNALELLKLADKFGCSDLKMLLEARIVETPALFCVKNAAELVLLADAKNCALLLERSMQLIAENLPNVKETEGWKHIKESPKLLEAILDVVSNRSKTETDPDGGDSVSALRKRAFEQGLDADGSRQDLIKRLKANADGENESR